MNDMTDKERVIRLEGALAVAQEKATNLENELSKERAARTLLEGRVNDIEQKHQRWAGMGTAVLVLGGVLAGIVTLLADGTEAVRNLKGN